MTRVGGLACALGVLLSIAAPLHAQSPVGGGPLASDPGPREVVAVRIDEAVRVDGRLDEHAWALAAPAADFVQQQPFEGKPARLRSEVRFLYDTRRSTSAPCSTTTGRSASSSTS